MSMQLNRNLFYFVFIIFLTSCGGSSNSGDRAYNENINSPPQLVALLDYSIDENTTSVATFTATDDDNDSITYTIDGLDAEFLSIGEATGILVFNNPPDFENAQDYNADNIYELNVNASDGSLIATLAIIIQINDFDENLDPTISLTLSSNNITTYSLSTLSWSSTNADTCSLTLDEQTNVNTSGSRNFYFSVAGTKNIIMECSNSTKLSNEEIELIVSDIIIKDIPDKVSLFNED